MNLERDSRQDPQLVQGLRGLMGSVLFKRLGMMAMSDAALMVLLYASFSNSSGLERVCEETTTMLALRNRRTVSRGREDWCVGMNLVNCITKIY